MVYFAKIIELSTDYWDIDQGSMEVSIKVSSKGIDQHLTMDAFSTHDLGNFC